VVADCTPALIFVDHLNLPRVQAVSGGTVPIVTDRPCDGSGVLQFAEVADHPPLGYTVPVPEDHTTLATLMYTSGSTGEPRGVMVSHRNIIANTASIVEYLGLTCDDRVMDVLPMSYSFGASLLHTHLRVGASLVLDNGMRWIERMLNRMQQHACTGFAGVPATYQLLLRKSSFPRKQFPTLRWLQQAGGKLPKLFLDELRQVAQGKRLYVMYGQTEATARLSYLPPELLETKTGSIGRGIPGVQLKVVDELGRPVRPGESGEIVAEGDNITLGYWNNPEETRRVYRHNRLYTGDTATVDEDGFVYILGRSRDFLKLGGIRVSAAQIEEAICAFPGTRELAIVGREDEQQGETVVLFIAHPRGEEVREELEEFCIHKLPLNQRPTQIHFLEQLPHNASGKVDRYLLRQHVEGAVGLIVPMGEPSKPAHHQAPV
jgi:acyl-CoA synthetase (AMP-forming)/AMP-acid ligase II